MDRNIAAEAKCILAGCRANVAARNEVAAALAMAIANENGRAAVAAAEGSPANELAKAMAINNWHAAVSRWMDAAHELDAACAAHYQAYLAAGKPSERAAA